MLERIIKAYVDNLISKEEMIDRLVQLAMNEIKEVIE